MIKPVPSFILLLFPKNNFRSLVIPIFLIAFCGIAYTAISGDTALKFLAKTAAPSGPAPTSDPQSRMAAEHGNTYQYDLEVAEVTPVIGTLSRLWSDQNDITVTIKNNGTEDQVNITVELTVTGVNPETLTQVIPSLAAGASTTVNFTGSVTSTGSQSIEVKVPDDDDNSNNTKLITQEITCNMYAYTGTEPIYDGFGFGTTGIITAKYQAPGFPVQLTGVTLHLSDNSANVGKSITGVLLDEFGNIIADTEPFIATADNLNTNIQLLFYVPAVVNANDIFYAGIKQDEGGQYPVGIALPAIAPADRYFEFPESGGAPTAYAGSGNLKIGVIGDIAAELNSSVTGQINAGEAATFTASPGFADYTFKVNGTPIQSSSNNIFTYFPANNDEVHVEISRNGCSSTPIGGYVMNVRDIVPANGILYVNKNNPVAGDGSSWANALTEVADALRWAKARQADWTTYNPLQIWVAGGTYLPLYSPADDNFGNDDGVNNSFLLVQHVKLYGGFAGTETSLSERDLTLTDNKSILSGDYNNNDVITGSGSSLNISGIIDNAGHVVISSGDVGSAVLDGFTITGGGGNMEEVEDIDVNGNQITKMGGGGMHNYQSSPVYTNLIIKGNTTGFYGGGIYNDNSSPVFTNVLVIDNYSEFEGGGILNSNLSSPVLTNVTISNNNSAVDGGGFTNISSTPLIRNCIVYGNSSSFMDINGSPVISYSLVEGLPADATNHNLDGSVDPQFLNPATDNYTLKTGSPAINAGNKIYYQAGEVPDLSNITLDLSGRPRSTGSTTDLGAFESRTQDQHIIADDITRIYGDADFELTASASSGLPVNYSSDDNATAEVYQDASDGNKWKVKTKKAGAVTITISQAGDDTYDPAENKDILLLVNRKELLVTADDKTRGYGENNPEFTISYSGFVGNDNVQSITIPEISTTATPGSAPGTYPIVLKDGEADNYDLKLVHGTLMIDGAIITIHQQPTGQSVCSGKTVTFTTNATGTAPIIYQWQQSTDSSTWSNIAGANKALLSITAASDLYYRCVLTAPGRVVNTSATKLEVKAVDKPVINTPNMVCLSEGRLTLNASLQGGVFSGTGVSGTTWIIDTLKPGPQIIQYTYGNSNGCTTTVSKTVTLSLCGEKGLVTVTKAQPNPTSGIVTIKALLTTSAKQTVIVTNSFGQQVLKKEVSLSKGWNQLQFDLSGFGTGIYFFIITGHDKTPATMIRIMKR